MIFFSFLLGMHALLCTYLRKPAMKIFAQPRDFYKTIHCVPLYFLKKLGGNFLLIFIRISISHEKIFSDYFFIECLNKCSYILDFPIGPISCIAIYTSNNVQNPCYIQIKSDKITTGTVFIFFKGMYSSLCTCLRKKTSTLLAQLLDFHKITHRVILYLPWKISSYLT